MRHDPDLGPEPELASRHFSETDHASSKQKPSSALGSGRRSVRKLHHVENTGPMVPSQRDVMPTLRDDFELCNVVLRQAEARAISPEVSGRSSFWTLRVHSRSVRKIHRSVLGDPPGREQARTMLHAVLSCLRCHSRRNNLGVVDSGTTRRPCQ